MTSRLFINGAQPDGADVRAWCCARAMAWAPMAMAGGCDPGAVFCVAWPTGEFGGMGLEGSVRLGYRRELEAETDPAARQAPVRQAGRPGSTRAARRSTSPPPWRSTPSSTRPTPAAGSSRASKTCQHAPRPAAAVRGRLVGLSIGSGNVQPQRPRLLHVRQGPIRPKSTGRAPGRRRPGRWRRRRRRRGRG